MRGNYLSEDRKGIWGRARDRSQDSQFLLIPLLLRSCFFRSQPPSQVQVEGGFSSPLRSRRLEASLVKYPQMFPIPECLIARVYPAEKTEVSKLWLVWIQQESQTESLASELSTWFSKEHHGSHPMHALQGNAALPERCTLVWRAIPRFLFGF